MNFKIDPSIIAQYPGVKIGLLIGKNLDNAYHSEEIIKLLRDIEKEVQGKYSLENIATLPKIIDWREAYRAFGFKPSEYRSSVEALLRRILQGKQLPIINPLVDLYNVISVKYLVPAGGGDLKAVVGNIILTIAGGTEQFTMLGSSESMSVKPLEVIYRDKEKVLCRAWNYRESDTTKITENTNTVYLILEGLEHTSQEEMNKAVSELKILYSQYCGGVFQQFILDKDNQEVFF